MPDKIAKWTKHEFSTGIFAGEDYLQFQEEAKADLKRQAEAAGFQLFQFNKNHYHFSAVLQDKDAGDFLYIYINDVRYDKNWYNKVLYRTMKHEKDWTGGPNHFCPWNELTDALSGMKQWNARQQPLQMNFR